MLTKSQILESLSRFAHQRPRLDFANYGDAASYRAESRAITRDLHDVNDLLTSISWRDSITAEKILDASQHAFSGRLSIDPNTGEINYCTGQYWPTEYRKAVCAVLASCLWDYWRENTTTEQKGDAIRKIAHRELSRSVANGYFR